MTTRIAWRMALLLCAVLSIGACDSVNQGLGKDTPEYTPTLFNAKLWAGIIHPASKAVVLVGQEGAIWRSENGTDWSFVSTPPIQTLKAVNVNADKGTLITVGDATTILRSDDAGHSWQTVTINKTSSADLNETQLKTVIYQPSKNTWVAAGDQNTILRSEDDGKTWELVSFVTSENQIQILSLFLEKNTNDLFFGGQYGTMGHSSDGGKTWSIKQHDMEFAGEYNPHIVNFHQFGDVIVAGCDEGRLLVSKDGGENWRLVIAGTSGYIASGTYDPVNKSMVMTTQIGEIVYSLDQGETWILNKFRVKNWPSDEIPLFTDVHFDTRTQSLITLGNSGIIARSKDGGVTWETNWMKSLFNLSVTTFLYDPERNLYVAAGLGGFIMISKGLQEKLTDGWKLIEPGIDVYMRSISHIPDTDTFVMVGQLGGVWRSENDGKSWDFIEPKYPYPNQPPHLRDMIIDPQTKALVAAGPDGSIMRSTDAGKTWVSAFQGVIGLGEAFTQLLIDEKRDTLIACEALYHSVYMSKDGGASWTKVTKIPTGDRNLWHGAILKKKDLIVVTGERGAIGVSGDGGYTWDVVETDIKGDMYGAYADENSGALFVVGDKGIILRSDDGKTWTQVESQTRNTLRRITTEPKTGALLAFGQVGTILRSTDGGKQWTSIPNSATGELREATIEPGSNNILLTGRDGVILRSSDSGLSWEKLTTHTLRHLRGAATNPRTGTIIAAGEPLVRLARK